MKKYFFLMFILFSVLFFSESVFAQDDSFANLTYPIAELGNCQNRKACETYCEKADNMKACLDFAEKQGLLAKEDIEAGRRILALGQTAGPGGCRGQIQCEAYCDQIDHIKECIAFAEKNNLIPPDELEEAKKVIQAIDRGLTPPKCKSKKECDVFCSRPENMEGCIAFAKEAGLMPPEEMAEAEKMLAALKKGAKPPACAGKKECDIYCSQAEHMQECMEFGIAAGFIPPEEMENVKKTLQALKQGIKPPNCRGKEECDVYCQTPEHMAECMEFGIAAGFIPPEEIENAKKTLEALKKGVKPPNCQGREQCDVYCSQVEHMQECMEFALAAGFMSPEEVESAKKSLEAMRKGVKPPNCQGKEECDIYCSQDEHFDECVNFAEAAGFMSKEDAERVRKTRGKGPGGCKGEEECKAFCENPENMEACIDFAVLVGDMTQEEADRAKQGMQMQQQGFPAGPGGCRTEEECRVFCEKPENIQQCMQVGPGSGGEGMAPGPGQEMMPPEPGMTAPPSQEQINQYQQGQVPPQEFMQAPQTQPQVEPIYPGPDTSVPPTGEAPLPPNPEPAPLPPSSLLRAVDMFLANLIFALTQ